MYCYYALERSHAAQRGRRDVPAPIYQKWGQDYNKLHPDIQVNYQSIGSGAGVKQFTAGTVDFGASDAAMSDEEIAKVPAGVVMLPMTAGSIVLAYNLPGVADLKLSRTPTRASFWARSRIGTMP